MLVYLNNVQNRDTTNRKNRQHKKLHPETVTYMPNALSSLNKSKLTDIFYQTDPSFGVARIQVSNEVHNYKYYHSSYIMKDYHEHNYIRPRSILSTVSVFIEMNNFVK